MQKSPFTDEEKHFFAEKTEASDHEAEAFGGKPRKEEVLIAFASP